MPSPLLTEMRNAIRVRHYSMRTERAYVDWVKRYVRFHGLRHPSELGTADVARFLTWLATERNVAASTQNQALNAIVFLYTNRAAAAMSLIQSAKLNGHDPYAYLKDVLGRLPTHPASRIEELLPHCWTASDAIT